MYSNYFRTRTMKTVQINFRIEPEIKRRATERAASLGINLNEAVRMFLSALAFRDGTVRIVREIDMEAVFDEGVRRYFESV